MDFFFNLVFSKCGLQKQLYHIFSGDKSSFSMN